MYSEIYIYDTLCKFFLLPKKSISITLYDKLYLKISQQNMKNTIMYAFKSKIKRFLYQFTITLDTYQ